MYGIAGKKDQFLHVIRVSRFVNSMECSVLLNVRFTAMKYLRIKIPLQGGTVRVLGAVGSLFQRTLEVE